MSTKYHILIVDDDVSVCSLLRLFFTRHGYDVSLATNGVEGLEVVKQCWPDLIMSDTHMPQMGGIEMAEILRSDQNFAAIPIILLTGSVDTDVVKHMTTHFDAVIAKPFHFAQLAQTVTDLLERVKESRQ
ncbi:MAG: response regulator [Chloroflexota bacterium]